MRREASMSGVDEATPEWQVAVRVADEEPLSVETGNGSPARHGTSSAGKAAGLDALSH